MRTNLVWCALVVAACGGREPWLGADGRGIAISAAVVEVEFAAPFPVEVVVLLEAGDEEPAFDASLLRPLYCELVEERRQAERGRKQLTWTCRARALQRGEVLVPAPRLEIVGGDGVAHEVVGAALSLRAVSALPATGAGAIEQPGLLPLPVERRGWWWGAAAAALGVAASIGVWLRRPRGRPVAAPPAPPSAPPAAPPAAALAAVALAQLERLLADEPRARVELQEFHGELADIVRVFAAGRHHIRAEVRTSEELLAALPDQHLRACLRQCDLVKFADARPDGAASRQAVHDAMTFVRSGGPA